MTWTLNDIAVVVCVIIFFDLGGCIARGIIEIVENARKP